MPRRTADGNWKIVPVPKNGFGTGVMPGAPLLMNAVSS